MGNNTQLIKVPFAKDPVNLGYYDELVAQGITSFGIMNRVNRYGCEWESLVDNNTDAPAVWDGGDTITPSENWKLNAGNPDAWLMNHDKPATSEQYPFNGMGRVRLQKNLVEVEEGSETVTKNLLTQAMFEDSDGNPLTNTVFIIQYDFTLGEDITVPANCVLEFDGGSINNGTIIGNNTGINVQPKVKIFSDVDIQGSWNVSDIYVEWMDIPNANNCGNEVRSICRLQNDNIYQNIYLPNYDLAFTPTEVNPTLLILSSNTNVNITSTIRVNGNSLTDYAVVKIDYKKNIIIGGGGSIVGDVGNHIYVEGSTSEHGHGISVKAGYYVTIQDLEISRCIGDGIYLGGDAETEYGQYANACRNITVKNVKCLYNRRQGMSVVHIDGLNIYNSDFSFTGAIEATDPSSGIDFEPNDSTRGIQNVTIDSCRFVSNAKQAVVFSKFPVVFRNIYIRDSVIGDCPTYFNDANNKLALTTSNGVLSLSTLFDNIRIERCKIRSLSFGVLLGSASKKDDVYLDDCDIYALLSTTNDGNDVNAHILHFNNCRFDGRFTAIPPSDQITTHIWQKNSGEMYFNNCIFDSLSTTFANQVHRKVEYKECRFINMLVSYFTSLVNCVTDSVSVYSRANDIVIANNTINGSITVNTTEGNIDIFDNIILGVSSGHPILISRPEGITENTAVAVISNTFNNGVDSETEKTYLEGPIPSLVWKNNN